MRMLHTMIRVGDLERSLRFYCEVLGMQLLRRKDYPDGRFTLAFVGYGPEDTNTVVELTHNWDTAAYDLGVEAVGRPARQILFVSSNGWDAIGATWYGYCTLWVNRYRQPLEALDTEPTRIGSSLRDVLEFFPAPQKPSHKESRPCRLPFPSTCPKA